MAGDSKIKLFKFTLEICQDFGIYSPLSYRNRSPINLRNFFFLFSLTICFIGTAGFLLFDANSMIEYGMSFYICTTVVLSIIAYLILLWQMENILKLIENCERFIEKRTNSAIVYKDTNKKIEQLTEFLANALLVTDITFMLFPLLYTIVNYYFLASEKESYYLLCQMWWPFDWKTPHGYLVIWLVEFAGSVSVVTTAMPCFNIICGSSWLFIVIAQDITNDVVAFNKIVKMLKNRDKDLAEPMEYFCDIIKSYMGAKELINRFNEINRYSLFAFFSWDMVTISSLLVTLQFQLWDDNSKMVEIIIQSILILWLCVYNLVICEPGERVTNHFDQFDLELDRCDWNKLRIEMQRMYLILLSDTQQPKNLRCFGGIECTRETFKKITTKGFSYFMTLRNFRE